MWSNIPVELQELPQWVVAVIIDDRKMPMNANTGAMTPASVTDPKTWASFNQACAIAEDIPGAAVGLVLTAKDPYVIVDLDDKEKDPATPEELELHHRIIQQLGSYTERSHSGRGYHVVLRGTLPPGRRRRGKVEVYDTERYMICTGNVAWDIPIAERTDLISELVHQMGPSDALQGIEYHQPATDKYTDQEVYDRIQQADNFQKFLTLWNGRLTDLQAIGCSSYSEAVFSFVEMMRFYTDNNADQAFRIYLASPLAQRPDDPDTAKKRRNLTRKYFDRSWNKAYAREMQNPQLSLEQLQAMYGHLVPTLPVASQDPATNTAPSLDLAPPVALPAAIEAPQPEDFPISLPPGLVGEIAQYFHQTVIRPVPEIALVSALAFMGGICGRAYNISRTGLNQYFILIAPTGTGKEGAKQGMDSLLSAMQQRNMMFNPESIQGPGAFASGQALVRVLDEKQCFVSVLGEFGLKLQQLSDNNANSAQIMLRTVLLDLYNKSGWADSLSSSVYSDKEKNTKHVRSPAVTILGESTPERFFEGLSASHIDEGLIPRFTLVEYKGARPDRNPYVGCAPPAALVDKCLTLWASCGAVTQQNGVVQVATDADAQALLDAFDARATANINSSGAEVYRHIWNRAHLKALKLAGLIAVGVHPYQPVVTAEIAQWCISFIERDVSLMMRRFESGDVGGGDSKQEHDLYKAIKIYFDTPAAHLDRIGYDAKMQQNNIVPKRFLSQRTSNLASFKNDPLRAVRALDKTIQTLVDAGALVKVLPAEAIKFYNTTGTLYFYRTPQG